MLILTRLLKAYIFRRIWQVMQCHQIANKTPLKFIICLSRSDSAQELLRVCNTRDVTIIMNRHIIEDDMYHLASTYLTYLTSNNDSTVHAVLTYNPIHCTIATSIPNARLCQIQREDFLTILDRVVRWSMLSSLS